MVSVVADYYDGLSAKRHEVVISLDDAHIRVSGDEVERVAAPGELRISERMGAAPRLVTFPDGAFCEVRDFEALERLLRETGHRESLVVRWQTSLRWIFASLAVLVVFGLALYSYGVPWLARAVAERIPARVTAQLDEQVLAHIDAGLAGTSRLPPARREEIGGRFSRMQNPGGERIRHQILFRSSNAFGANAVALPAGTIIVFDDLVAQARNDDELMGVLAHEMGHVQQRHGLRLILQNSLVGLVAAWYLGDMSTLLAGAPAVLLAARYSRDFERDADTFAAEMLKANGIPPARLADLLERLTSRREAQGDGSGWGRYGSTHPETEERLRFLRSQR